VQNPSAQGWRTSGTPASSIFPGGFRRPSGLTFDDDGNMYVVEARNHRIQKFNANGISEGWIGFNRNNFQNTAGFTNHLVEAEPSQYPGSFDTPMGIEFHSA